ncbi:MAG TPA: methyltransferase domain-containing protein [Nocardioides sp.]|nr:methyltransferase domain-containing protein [Nocardioides sp.]
MFFDDYPLFLETSETAAWTARLGWRHKFIIEDNADLLAGKRVLDLASHDGRWSFAALKAGASHVTGVEFRPDLVANAGNTFQHYGVDPSTYRFIPGDLFELLRDPAALDVEVDVVLCLGFFYHTLRYTELLNGWRRLAPEHILLDTSVILGDRPRVALNLEHTEKQSAAADTGDVHAYEGLMLTGRPTAVAVEFMLDGYGFDVVRRAPWQTYDLGEDRVPEYTTGRRVSWVARPRT